MRTVIFQTLSADSDVRFLNVITEEVHSRRDRRHKAGASSYEGVNQQGPNAAGDCANPVSYLLRKLIWRSKLGVAVADRAQVVPHVAQVDALLGDDLPIAAIVLENSMAVAAATKREFRAREPRWQA